MRDVRDGGCSIGVRKGEEGRGGELVASFSEMSVRGYEPKRRDQRDGRENDGVGLTTAAACVGTEKEEFAYNGQNNEKNGERENKRRIAEEERERR